MADYFWPALVEEGQTGTQVRDNLVLQLQGGSDIRKFLNASSTATSRNLDWANLHRRAAIRAAQFKPADLTYVQFSGNQSVNVLQRLTGDKFAAGNLSNTALASTTVGQRVLALRHKDRPVQACWTQVTKEGILRGEVLETISASGGSATASINWDSGTSPTVKEVRPTDWTSPASITVVVTSKLGSGWVGSNFFVTARLTTVTASGFSLHLDEFLRVSATAPWVRTSAGGGLVPFHWEAAMNHA
jgi:hypothetical protein